MTAPTSARRFDLSRHVDERTLRHLGAPIDAYLWRMHAEGLRDLEAAVIRAGYQFYGENVQITMRFEYIADVTADGQSVRSS